MDKKLLLDKILGYFIKNKKDIPSELGEKVKLWKEIVSTHDLTDIPREILEAEDMYLRCELLNKKLTNGEKIKTVGEELVKNIRYSDFICLWNGDITTIYADAIVHLTSLKKMINDQEKVDKIILKSGMRLRKKCRDAVGDSEIKKSDILITRAYNLPCDFIIHVIEPDGRNKDYEEYVKASYVKILECAKNNMIRTVVMPCIAIKKDEKYIDIMLDSIAEYLDKYHQIMNLKIIINADEEDLKIIKDKLMKRVIK